MSSDLCNYVPLTAYSRDKPFNKVFCIGLDRCAHRSLHAAFRLLGLKSSFNSYEYDDKIEAFTGHTYVKLFPQIDDRLENIKFILNTRNIYEWLCSRIKQSYYDEQLIEIDNQLLLQWAKERWIHYQYVYEYFQNHSKSELLIFNPADGDNYGTLIDFFGLKHAEPLRHRKFPHCNARPIFVNITQDQIKFIRELEEMDKIHNPFFKQHACIFKKKIKAI